MRAAGHASMQSQPPQGDEAFHERGIRSLRLPVAVPASVGPLPLNEAFGKLICPRVAQAKGKEIVKGVAFLGCAAPDPAVYDPDPLLVATTEQPTVDLLP